MSGLMFYGNQERNLNAPQSRRRSLLSLCTIIQIGGSLLEAIMYA